MRFIPIFFLFVLLGCCKSYDFPSEKKRDKLLNNNLQLGYKEKVREPSFENLDMLGEVKKGGVYGQRLYGMILRSLRFKNITDAVEKKYKLPRNLLLAMIMHESGGVDLLPNSSDDGGIGLIHMQPKLATQFGLKTYKNCEKLVCKKHGKELRKLIIKNKYDRKKLVEHDDRFHPILNIDAAARMLLYYRSGKQVKSTPLKTAIYGYAGRYNYSKYYDNIVLYMDKLQDEGLIKDVEESFNELNESLTINDKRADFNDYLEAHQKQNLNYGLKDY